MIQTAICEADTDLLAEYLQIYQSGGINGGKSREKFFVTVQSILRKVVFNIYANEFHFVINWEIIGNRTKRLTRLKNM